MFSVFLIVSFKVFCWNFTSSTNLEIGRSTIYVMYTQEFTLEIYNTTYMHLNIIHKQAKSSVYRYA